MQVACLSIQLQCLQPLNSCELFNRSTNLARKIVQNVLNSRQTGTASQKEDSAMKSRLYVHGLTDRSQDKQNLRIRPEGEILRLTEMLEGKTRSLLNTFANVLCRFFPLNGVRPYNISYSKIPAAQILVMRSFHNLI